jgi:hypothetical protein
MWSERQKGFVRIPVPKTFDRQVEQLENSDSVMFESISLPSLQRHTGPTIDLSDDFMSDDETADTSPSTFDLQLRALLDRVYELETETQHKDAEIARLRELLVKHTAPDPFRERYEKIKLQYDKLKESLALEGRIRRVQLKSLRPIKLPS